MNRHFDFFKELVGNDEEVMGKTVAIYFNGIFNSLGEEKFFEKEYDNLLEIRDKLFPNSNSLKDFIDTFTEVKMTNTDLYEDIIKQTYNNYYDLYLEEDEKELINKMADYFKENNITVILTTYNQYNEEYTYKYDYKEATEEDMVKLFSVICLVDSVAFLIVNDEEMYGYYADGGRLFAMDSNIMKHTIEKYGKDNLEDSVYMPYESNSILS